MLGLVRERVALKHARAGRRTKPVAKIWIFKKHAQGISQGGFIAWRYQNPVLSMLNDLGDSLPVASDDRLAGSHGLEIDATKSFKLAGQSEDGAATHGFGDFSS